jgi:hypothetical protein
LGTRRGPRRRQLGRRRRNAHARMAGPRHLNSFRGQHT